MMGAVVSSSAQRIIIGAHTQQRMTERHITITMIEAVVRNPTITVNRADGCSEYTGTWQGKSLKVVVDEKRVPPFVVTVYWT